MPELSNIQTFEKISGTDFRPALNKFEYLLKQIRLWNDEIEQEFKGFEWKVEDNGFVYSTISQVGQFNTKYSDIKVRPLVMALTPAVDSSFKDNWLRFDLLIETGEIRNDKYINKAYDLVEKLTFEMHRQFKQTGTYFTDEAQDGQDFKGLLNDDKSKFWQFDYALIPLTLKEQYLTPPPTHAVNLTVDFLEAFNIERWTKKPSR